MNQEVTDQTDPRAIMEEAQAMLEEIDRREREDILSSYIPYPKQAEFHAAGAHYRERLMSAGNQTGKTLCAAAEVAMHLSGRYPRWWVGRRFSAPVTWICSGVSWQLMRDNVQRALLGPRDALGTGFVPRTLIHGDPVPGPVSESVSAFRVNHVRGGRSICHLVPYAAGREAIQSYTAHGFWGDEEPPINFYYEAMTRTNIQSGPVILTFTPLLGMSDVAMRFFEPSEDDPGRDQRIIIQMTLDDAAHYTPENRRRIEASYPEHERDARCRGIPKLGSGAIYPISQDVVIIDDFPIPDFWPRVYGLDVGWNKTAAVWAAWDRDTDVVYLYSEYYQGLEKPAVHATAINSRGHWIPGVIDPASRGRSQSDGTQLIEEYRRAGLNLTEADNAVEAGIYAVWSRMSTGRLKVFKSLRNWQMEHGIYRRDDHGKVVKHHDHLMDSSRYLVLSGLPLAVCKKTRIPDWRKKIEHPSGSYMSA